MFCKNPSSPSIRLQVSCTPHLVCTHTTNHTNDDDSAQNKNSQKLENPSGGRDLRYGAKRIRTADPLHAMQVLYQLSYGPSDVEIALEQSFVVRTLHREDP